MMAQVSLACNPRITMRAPKMHCSIRRGIRAQSCYVCTCLLQRWAGNVCEAPSCPICGIQIIQRMIPVEAELSANYYPKIPFCGSNTPTLLASRPLHGFLVHHASLLSSDPYRYRWCFLNSLLRSTHSRASLTWCSLAICIRRPRVSVTIASAGS